MKRLEYARRTRTAPGHAKNATEAVMCLAQVARERHRLQQERRGLAQRLSRIDARLGALVHTETRLAPMIQARVAASQQEAQRTAPPAPLARSAPLPAGVTEVTLQY
jgi:cell division septum initiation protein DivIVA